MNLYKGVRGGIPWWLGIMALSSCLGATVDVRSCGARGDGRADDTLAFEAAIKETNDIYVPAGTYRLLRTLHLSSGVHLHGDGNGSVLEMEKAGDPVISARIARNVRIDHLAISGGGAEGKGIRGVTGIRFSGVSEFSIDAVSISHCGMVRSTSPTNDGGWGGFGIVIDARAAASNSGTISGCHIAAIQGGGMMSGDGIYIGGNNDAPAVTASDITIEGCDISNVGRHCIAISGGPKSSVPRRVTVLHCTVSKSALSGVDVEGAENCSVLYTTFRDCGLAAAEYDVDAAYGPSYRLRAAVAIDNTDKGIIISSCDVNHCQYGITYGAAEGLTIDSVKIENSQVSDMALALAAAPRFAMFSNIESLTPRSFLLAYTRSTSTLYLARCHFAGPVIINGDADVTFDGCTLTGGVRFVDARSKTFTRIINR